MDSRKLFTIYVELSKKKSVLKFETKINDFERILLKHPQIAIKSEFSFTNSNNIEIILKKSKLK
jgi:hypothetical protein